MSSTNQSSPPVVSLISLGGTITMVADADGGIVPTLTAENLIESVPGIEQIADIRAATLLSLGSGALILTNILTAVQRAHAEVAAGAVGVVIIQGTDTIEETAYFAELIWDRPEPLVFVGAMRGPAQLSADGPANITAACLVAASPAARGRGALVVLDNTVHHASLVHKAHSTALSAFQSYDGLKLGRIIEGAVQLRSFERPGQVIDPSGFEEKFVPLWTTWLGDDGAALRALASASPAGVVIAGLGVGHASPGLADVIETVARECPVILSTRIGEGGAMRKSYGYPGAEIDLQRRGAIVSGVLDGFKARILLALLVGIGAGPAEIAEQFEQRSRFW